MVPAHAHDGDRLIALMRRAGVSDAQLAEATKVSVQAVGKWRATGEIARNRLARVCETLQCSADELLGLQPISTTAGRRSLIAYDRARMEIALRGADDLLASAGAGAQIDLRTRVTLAMYDVLSEHVGMTQAKRIVTNMMQGFVAATDNAMH